MSIICFKDICTLACFSVTVTLKVKVMILIESSYPNTSINGNYTFIMHSFTDIYI